MKGSVVDFAAASSIIPAMSNAARATVAAMDPVSVALRNAPPLDEPLPEEALAMARRGLAEMRSGKPGVGTDEALAIIEKMRHEQGE
jgi:hypothetical protein